MKIIDVVTESNYLYQDINSPNFIQYKIEETEKLRISFFMRIVLFIYIFIKSLRQISAIIVSLKKDKNLYIYETANQKRALKPLFQNDKNKLTMSLHSCFKADVEFCEILPLLFGALYLPYFCYCFFVKKTISANHRFLLDKYLISAGYYRYYQFLLKKHSISSLVVSNDHNARVRSIILAANELGIPVTYIQHASVSKYFPPLNLFSLSCLDGKSSLDIYERIGFLESKVLITGAIRNFDLTSSKIQIKKKKVTIGVAVNNFVNVNKLKIYIDKTFNHNSNIILKIRLHPSQMKDEAYYREAFMVENVKIVGSWLEPLNDFFDSIDVLFSGSSSIHLDALRVKILPVLLDIDDGVLDYYGYLEHGCVLSYSDFLSLKKDDYPIEVDKLISKAIFFDAAIDFNPEQKKRIICTVIDEINNINNRF